jgi:hypothetical protein
MRTRHLTVLWVVTIALFVMFAVPPLEGEELLVFKDGSEILVKRVKNGFVDCRGQPVREVGTVRATSETCPVQATSSFLGVVPLRLPRTASGWAEYVIFGLSCFTLGWYLLMRRKRWN